MASASAIKIRIAFLEERSSIGGWVGSILRQVESIRGFKLQRSRALSVRVLLAAFQPGRDFWGGNASPAGGASMPGGISFAANLVQENRSGREKRKKWT